MNTFPFLATRSLDIGYGRTPIARSLTLEFEPHQVIVCIGVNGSGKTTFIRTMLGFIPPLKGEIRVVGYTPLPYRHVIMKKVGYIPEHPYLPENSTFDDLVKLIHLTKGQAIMKKLQKLWNSFDLPTHCPLSSFSRGQKTLAHFCFALARDPFILVIDDPTSGIDPGTRSLLFEGLVDYLSEDERTIFMTTHDLDFAERFADHILLIHKGHILLNEKLADLKKRSYIVECMCPRENHNLLTELLSQMFHVRMIHQTHSTFMALIETDNADLITHVQTPASISFTFKPASLEHIFIAFTHNTFIGGDS